MHAGLDDAVIVVTGASGGIGAATARVLAADGARLVLHAHRHLARAERLAGELPTESVALAADLRQEAAVESLFDEALTRFGRLDGLVANAGVWPQSAAAVVDLTLERWSDTIRTDLTSAFLCCRAFLRHLRELPRETASIVLVASTAALFGEADHADYATAKAALAYGLTASLKNEIVRLASRGRVNCICPGWTRTPMAEEAMTDPALMERVFATMPLRKVAEADDVAHAIAFLLSDRLAGHISGVILPVAGGMEGRLMDRPGTKARRHEGAE